MPGSAAAGTVAPHANGVVDDVAIDGRLASRVGLSWPGGRFKPSATAAVADSGYSESISPAIARGSQVAASATAVCAASIAAATNYVSDHSTRWWTAKRRVASEETCGIHSPAGSLSCFKGARSESAWRAGDEAMSQAYPSAAFRAGSRLVPRLAHSRSMARGVRAQRCRQRPCLVCQGGAALPRYDTRPKMPAVDRRWRAAEQIHCGPGLSPASVHACRAAGALVLHRGRKTVAIPRARGAAAPLGTVQAAVRRYVRNAKVPSPAGSAEAEGFPSTVQVLRVAAEAGAKRATGRNAVDRQVHERQSPGELEAAHAH